MNFGHLLEKKENLTENELLLAAEDADLAANQGDRWTFVAVLPETSFIHTIHTSERTQEQAAHFVQKIKDRSDGQAPLFHSDSWFYETVLVDTYCTYEPVPYSGRGRPPHPKQVVDPQLTYVQVHKQRNSKGKIEKVATRIVLGDETHVLDILNDAQRSKTVNTDFVESRNGKFRKDNARLIRKTLCHSKKAIYHDAQICFLTQVFNYTRTIDDLKIMLNPMAKKFEQKYQHRTPAMAQNITDKIWSIKELLVKRPQKGKT
jgi:IS1 family transposase